MGGKDVIRVALTFKRQIEKFELPKIEEVGIFPVIAIFCTCPSLKSGSPTQNEFTSLNETSVPIFPQKVSLGQAVTSGML